MPSIPDPLNRRLRDILVRSKAFDSAQSLRNVFATASIAPWAHIISDTPSDRAARVAALIADLHDQANDRDENALLLFLHVVLDQQYIPQGTADHRDLTQLATELAQLCHTTPPGPRRSPTQKLMGIILIVGVMIIAIKVRSGKTPSTPTPLLAPAPVCLISLHNTTSYPHDAILEVTEIADPIRSEVTKIAFEHLRPNSYATWVIRLDNCDLTGYTRLSFWIKGEKGGEQFEVGLKSSDTESGREPKIPHTALADWEHRYILLQDFQDRQQQSFDSVENVSLGFRYDLSEKGAIYVNGFTFEQ